MIKIKFWIQIIAFALNASIGFGQSKPDSKRNEIAFVSDTQAPMWIETLWLKQDHNTLATKLIFKDIMREFPKCLFILGDVVSLGQREKKWIEMDQYLASARSQNIPVYAILGNHDVMGNPQKGEEQFNKRFPDQINTGFYKVVDSIGIVLLNSNFKTLSKEKQRQQQDFLHQTLAAFDSSNAIKVVIVTCHHAPYSNSKIVGSNTEVQKNFVPAYIQSKKAKLFVTGHAHDFEYFEIQGKKFLTLGGGGGLHQPLKTGSDALLNKAIGYAPQFHYLLLKREGDQLILTSQKLKDDFSDFETGYQFSIP